MKVTDIDLYSADIQPFILNIISEFSGEKSRIEECLKNMDTNALQAMHNTLDAFGANETLTNHESVGHAAVMDSTVLLGLTCYASDADYFIDGYQCEYYDFVCACNDVNGALLSELCNMIQTELAGR